jgi:archaemetzincin
LITLFLSQDIDQAEYAILQQPLKDLFHEELQTGLTLPLEKTNWNAKRRQYQADSILDILPTPSGEDRNLGILSEDIYAFGLNFVFGEADAHSRKALISIKRLQPVFYNQTHNEELLHFRIIVEVIHELGHTWGLRHCPNLRCVMHFSNSVEDTDIKGWQFCPVCARRLSYRLRLSTSAMFHRSSPG